MGCRLMLACESLLLFCSKQNQDNMGQRRLRITNGVGRMTYWTPLFALLAQVGVGVKSDFGRLMKDYGVKARGGLDLAVASRQYLTSFLGSRSLSALCTELLQLHLPKTTTVRMSEWEAKLSDEQVILSVLYARPCCVFSGMNCRYPHRSSGSNTLFLFSLPCGHLRLRRSSTLHWMRTRV